MARIPGSWKRAGKGSAPGGQSASASFFNLVSSCRIWAALKASFTPAAAKEATSRLSPPEQKATEAHRQASCNLTSARGGSSSPLSAQQPHCHSRLGQKPWGCRRPSLPPLPLVCVLLHAAALSPERGSARARFSDVFQMYFTITRASGCGVCQVRATRGRERALNQSPRTARRSPLFFSNPTPIYRLICWISNLGCSVASI